MKKFKNLVFRLLFALVVSYIASVIINIAFFNAEPTISVFVSNGMTWTLFITLFLVGVVLTLSSPSKLFGGIPGKSSKTSVGGKDMEQYYSSRFVTDSELKNESKFRFCLYSRLSEDQKKDGIPLRAKRVKNDTYVNMYKPIHTIVIGTTGAGKTTMLVNPSIQILSECKSRPSLVVTDPKGELYQANIIKLKERGYDVQVIDLREPDKSSKWNPLDRSYDLYKRSHHLEEEVITHRKEDPEDYPKLQKIKGSVYKDEWYEFDGVAYPDAKKLEQDLVAKKDKFINISTEDITNIASVLCPISGQDPSWSRGAQGFIKAIMLAMLEDSLNPELQLTKEKFNFFNLTQIAARRDEDQNDPTATLRNYFQGRDMLSECVSLANTVVVNAAVTTKGYLGHVTGSLQMFSDNGICYLTSGTDLDLANFSDKPSALFIKIPDEKDSRHALANMYISQLYNALIERANKEIEICLPRNVYFLLDEFGNLPKIEKLKAFITAGRSRKIFLMLVIQDYTQLNSVYGDQDAATIRNNCNIHIFIGTKDSKTREDFSKNCGNISLDVTTKSESSGKQPDSKTYSSNTTTTTRPLIYPEQLDHLKLGQVIINIFPEFSLDSEFTPAYLNPQYKLKPADPEYMPSRYLDKHAVFYDIGVRNSIILSEDGEDEDDDDFDFISPFKKK